ncbi:sensor domain-containing protein [Nitrincola sp. A-D6]|uniref:sensor domain-containing protein n=1 Tax=Nitrincola sp. A-D6 TaxID=1545442 RepID=UPI00068F8AE2|nr:EAL domain-containing protein [Nitrincola sp. A-D6]
MPVRNISKFRAEKVTLAYFLFAMLWILTSDYLLGLLVSDASLMVSLSTYKGILFVATTSILLYLVLRIWVRGSVDEAQGAQDSKGLVFVFSGMALLVPLVALSLFRIAAPQALDTAAVNVQMIAEMKSEQVDEWLSERAAEAGKVGDNRALAGWVEAWLLEEDATAAGHLSDYLQNMHWYQQFDGISLQAVHSDSALYSGELLSAPSNIDAYKQQAIQTAEPVFTGLIESDYGFSISWVVPVLQSGESERVLAVLVMSLDAESHLFPKLANWPIESHTAELFLIQTLSDERIQLLSPVRHTEIPLLSVVDDFTRVPVTQRGTETSTYHEDRVIAAYSPVLYGWTLVAQQHRHEVLSPVYMLAAWLGLLSLATMISVAFALRLVWQQNRRLQQAAYKMQAAEKDKLLLKFFELPFVGMAITDPETGRWMRFNPELCRLLGYNEQELKELTWQAVTHPDDIAADQQAFARMQSGIIDSYTLEKQFIRKSGVAFTALMNVCSVRAEDGQLQHSIATIQDISEQKRYEADILHQRDLYNTLSETNQAIIRCTHLSELFAEVCRIAVVYGKMNYAWIGEISPDGGRLLQAFGQQPTHLEGVLTRDFQPLPESGPLRQVFETVRPVILNNTDDQTAFACFPVEVDGKVIAYLSLYADDAGFFSRDIMETLSEMAGDIGYAVRFIEQEDALKAAVQVVEASPVVLFRWENKPGWPVTYVSQNVSRWGYTASQFLQGRVDFKEIVHPDDRLWLEDEVTRYISQRREEYVQEYRIFTADDQVLWVEDHTTVIYAPDSAVLVIEGVVTDITSRKTIQQRIEFLARHDSLTGLPNRVDVLASIETSGNEHTALLMLDLDRFKDVNDSFGHSTGDQLLCQVAELLRKVSPRDALLARFGGDEFGLLIDRDRAALRDLAETLIEALRTSIQLPQGMEIRIGACVGIACLVDADNNAEELMRQADAALYKAKEAGREQLRFYSNELTQAAMARLDIEARLRSAMSEGQLEVYYQPQIDIESGQLMGAEALLRWKDPQQGYVSPMVFIPVAEQSGLIHPIGEWVMEEVCKAGKDWLDKGYPPLTLAVNLSSYQLRHGDVVHMIKMLLDKYDFPASGLEVELTESALMRREDEAEQVFDALKSMGVSLAIDDFGTGYSSLAYLKTFPLDVLKIDKSFIDDLEINAGDREIAAAVIVMGHTLGLKILAEGVENVAQLALLRDLGCDYYQGYLKSPAVSALEFETLFLAH